ncbi:EAL domain-containing protein [Kineococcus sp. R8]|uniref:putative bifunctional diguanylate cyclase/phosphodiesterase n=1 Tax=Kineococcus siccus TaxID=2696567 RepID=UPI001413135F|nr:EAL domain-containing protein [Kineococcus siccus]NAZ81202.1 EAL domain-containing protein [Kineococcus siccus]
MTVVVAVLALVVAALYGVIAVEIVPRLARIASEPARLISLARWGAFAFFMGCAATHVGIAAQVLLGAGHDMPGGGPEMAGPGALELALVHVLPHVAQVIGGLLFISIARRHLDIRLVSKEVAARLAQLEARFRASFEHSPIGIALLSTEPGSAGDLIQVNPALAAMLGYDEHDRWPGTNYRELLDPAHLGGSADDVVALLLGDHDELDVEQCYRHRLGHEVWVQVRTSLVRSDDGEVLFSLLQAHDTTEQRRQELALRHLADHDPLTGTVNRRRFEEELEHLVALGERYGQTAALLVVDLDGFKHVNDTYGHQHGDELLRRVASVLRERVRDTDLVARLGGDEFGVLCPQADAAGGATLADDLLRSLRESATVRVGQRVVRCTASIGVAAVGGGSGLGAAELLASADLALYESKDAGRDRVTVLDATAGRRTPVRSRLACSERVREALETGGFVLWEQPVVDLRTGRTEESELLVRMLDASTGVPLAPVHFLEVAERFGQVQALDRWVVGRALELLARRQAAGGTGVLHVNLAGASIADEALVDELVALVRDAPVDPRGLAVEVREAAVLGNLEAARRASMRLGALGCRFTLDDFGPGFGSFRHLQDLPYDGVKIDGDLVRDLATSTSDQLTVQALVAVCRGLGKQTVAEHVQDEASLALLRSFGVDRAQGFHLALPQPLPEDSVVAPLA